MKTFKLFVFAILLCAASGLEAQTFANSTNQTPASESFSTQDGLTNFISSQTTQRSVAPLTTNQADTSVMISQVGSNNEITANTQSTSGSVALIQQGDDNTTYTDVSATELQTTVIQNGNNNNYLNFNVFTKDFSETTVIQNGNNQNLIRHGGNALSDKLKVNMQGQGQSVIIRSFN